MRDRYVYEFDEEPGPGWRATGLCKLDAGRLIITEIHITPTDEDRIPVNGVTGMLLKSISPARIKDGLTLEAARRAAWLQERIDEVPDHQRQHTGVRVAEGLRDHNWKLAKAPRAGPSGTRGAPPLDEGYLRYLVAEYLDEIDVQSGRYGALKHLAERLDRPYDTVKDQLDKARKRGLFPQPGDEPDFKEA
jgi:hypothetical protein